MATPEENLTKLLQGVAAEENLQNYDISITPASSGGANFLSVLYKATISSPSNPNLNVFAKLGVLPEALREQIPIELVYDTEINFYVEIVKEYEALQDKYGIPVEERYKYPKYYAGSIEANKEAVVLEDLVSQGYNMFDRMSSINWEYASKAMEQLAKFHALSLAFRLENPEHFHKIVKIERAQMLFDAMYEQMKATFSQVCKNTVQFAPDHLKSRLNDFIDNNWTKEKYALYYAPTKAQILCHGDFRASNILFKRQAGKVTSLVPVDYQGVRVCPPCTDILYFIYSGSDADFRKLHMKRLLDHYYNTFAAFLRRLNVDPETTFSRTEFDQEFKQMRPAGLLAALFLLPTILATEDNVPNMADGGIKSFGNVKVTDDFQKRFLSILDEYVQWGLL